MKKKELLQLILDLQKRVSELEKSNSSQQFKVYPPIPEVFIPSVWTVELCSDGGQHQYPFPWHGTVPPACTKCGKSSPASPPYVVTCTSDIQGETFGTDLTKAADWKPRSGPGSKGDECRCGCLDCRC